MPGCTEAEMHSTRDVPRLSCEDAPINLRQPQLEWRADGASDWGAGLPDLVMFGGDFVSVQSHELESEDRIVRWSEDGQPRWTLSTSAVENSFDAIAPAPNGDLFVAGRVVLPPEGQGIRLLRLDIDGNTVHDVVEDDTLGVEDPREIVAAGDDGFVVHVGLPSGSRLDRYDAELERLWVVYPDPEANVLAFAADEDAMYVATRKHDGASHLDAYDAQGHPQWSKPMADFGVIQVSRVQLTVGQRLFALLGAFNSDTAALVALDDDGQVAWRRDTTTGSPDEGPQLTRFDTIGASPCDGVVLAGVLGEDSAIRSSVLIHLGTDGVRRELVRVRDGASDSQSFAAVQDVQISWGNEVMVQGSSSTGAPLWMVRY